MRGDGNDLQLPGRDAWWPTVPDDPFEQCEAAVWCISEGSKFTSCFLHFTLDIHKARFWRDRGRQSRNDHNNYLVRLDVMDVESERVIDCSSQKALRQWLHNMTGGKYLECDGIMEAIHNDRKSAGRRSEGKQEVLLKSRGDFPYHCLKRCNSRGELL